MTAGAEQYAVQEFIYNALSGDASLVAALGSASVASIFDGVADYEAVSPWVAFAPWVQGNDVRGVGTYRMGTMGLWVVRGVCTGTSYLPLKTIATRIDAVLHAAAVTTVTDGTIWTSMREMPFSMEEIKGGQEYRHQGGIYRIYASG